MINRISFFSRDLVYLNGYTKVLNSELSEEKNNEASNYFEQSPRTFTFTLPYDSWLDTNTLLVANREFMVNYDQYACGLELIDKLIYVYDNEVLVFVGVIETNEIHYDKEKGYIEYRASDFMYLVSKFLETTISTLDIGVISYELGINRVATKLNDGMYYFKNMLQYILEQSWLSFFNSLDDFDYSQIDFDYYSAGEGLTIVENLPNTVPLSLGDGIWQEDNQVWTVEEEGFYKVNNTIYFIYRKATIGQSDVQPKFEYELKRYKLWKDNAVLELEVSGSPKYTTTFTAANLNSYCQKYLDGYLVPMGELIRDTIQGYTTSKVGTTYSYGYENTEYNDKYMVYNSITKTGVKDTYFVAGADCVKSGTSAIFGYGDNLGVGLLNLYTFSGGFNVSKNATCIFGYTASNIIGNPVFKVRAPIINNATGAIFDPTPYIEIPIVDGINYYEFTSTNSEDLGFIECAGKCDGGESFTISDMSIYQKVASGNVAMDIYITNQMDKTQWDSREDMSVKALYDFILYNCVIKSCINSTYPLSYTVRNRTYTLPTTEIEIDSTDVIDLNVSNFNNGKTDYDFYKAIANNTTNTATLKTLLNDYYTNLLFRNIKYESSCKISTIYNSYDLKIDSKISIDGISYNINTIVRLSDNVYEVGLYGQFADKYILKEDNGLLLTESGLFLEIE